ncbi:hypothetical protein TRFO_07416 [Tritrichomonas foetus]|uniref:Uncharacterized protein n=1 Tax=Tritrichomonas foetus TaxID=1144522 RepID=A0A1J4JSW8_9EUKA|nr:hypothetical protein TRFO_07416 [Tritrichomonas foetus]|eukprot:OHT01842.1 hypothetical protein TRFO_07416 [Tritrichomonas foetus]
MTISNEIIDLALLSFVLFQLVIFFSFHVFGYKGIHYGIMVDAGSAGTRAHVFSWDSNDKYPHVKPYPDWHKGAVIKSHTPLAKAAADENAIPNIFHGIIEKVSKIIPAEFLPKTKMYIYATAGLRMLSITSQGEIIENTFHYLSENSPFKILRKNVRIMSGAEEAIYGWISVQHLLNRTEPTCGSIDMGGASIQVAFETKEKKNLHRILLNGKAYTIFGTSMLGLGVNQAMKRILHLNKNPCFPSGYITESIEGTGSFEKCQDLIKSIDIIPRDVSNETRSIRNFYGMASFYYTNEFFGLIENSTIDQLISSTVDFCSSNWTYLNKKYNSNPFLKNYCFFGSFQSTFLSDGFGFDFSRSFVVKSGMLNGAELSWAIGAMMKEVNSAKVDPYYIPSYMPIIEMNLFVFLCFVIHYLKLKIKGKNGFLSTRTSKLL